MAKVKNVGSLNIELSKAKKKTSQSGNDAMMKTSSLNKSKRKSYKAYRGQGR